MKKILVVLLRHKIKRKNKIIWNSGIDGESSSRLDKKLIMYSAEVLQKGSLNLGQPRRDHGRGKET